jgi:hypothetical protein
VSESLDEDAPAEPAQSAAAPGCAGSEVSKEPEKLRYSLWREPQDYILVRIRDFIVPAACLLLVWPRLGFGESFFARMERAFCRLARTRRLAVVAIGALTILARLALLPWIHVPQPKVHDEFSYLLAGDTFAQGRLANPPHPMWMFFDTFHVIQHPVYASMYPPGQGMALAVGKLLGQPWIGVVLGVAAMCMAFTWMLQAWVPEEWALLGGLLVWSRFAVFSYWMNSYWGGAVAATGAALALGAFARLRERETVRDALILGLGAGILAITRPLEGAIFFAPVGLAVVRWGFRCKAPERRALIRKNILLTAALVLACFGGFVGYYNHRLTGSALVFPHFIEEKMITTAVFLWQHDNPPIAYSNPQFDDFYHNFLPSLYQASWPAAVGQWWYKSTDFWEFFLGPALSIPFLALPWVFVERKNRLLFMQVALSALGLWVVVYYHAHYAAPLLAAVLVLLMQCMRALGRLRLLGRNVGVALTRLMVLFALLIGPVYFAQSLIPQPNASFEWLHRHAAAALAVSVLVLMVSRLSWPATKKAVAGQRAWVGASFELLLVIGIVLQVCELQRNLYADAFPYVDDVNEPFRKPVEDQLAAMRGQHLVLVRYSKVHNSGEEYVYNQADIDRSRTVWAREIPGRDVAPLLQYFRDRDVWIYEPDEDDSAARPYDPGAWGTAH